MHFLFAQFIRDCQAIVGGKKPEAVLGTALHPRAKAALTQLTKDDFVAEVERALAALSGASVTSPLLQAFTYVYEATAVRQAAGIKVPLKGRCATAAAEAVAGRTYHEVIREMRLLAHGAGVSVGEVQLARDITSKAKETMREEFGERYPDAVLIMTIQPDLLGGVRLFINNTAVDVSWRAQLQSILQARN